MLGQFMSAILTADKYKKINQMLYKLWSEIAVALK